MKLRRFGPAQWAILVFLFCFILDVIVALTQFSAPLLGMSMASSFIAYLAACWVWQDSRAKGMYYPSDLVYFYTWIYFPAYLYETKGMRGILSLALIVGSLLGMGYLWHEIIRAIYE